jgi:hypothetical protein
MTTKLKGTEMLARHSQHKPLQSSSHNDFVASGSHTSDLQEQSTVWSNSIVNILINSYWNLLQLIYYNNVKLIEWIS